MRFGSLFAGIGGIDLGLERAGMECRWQVEINAFCRAVLEKHWPSIPKLEDVRAAGRSNLESVDLICGGFPCQDISCAHTSGERLGLRGQKSGLWKEYLRIIIELRPRWVVIENVSLWKAWVPEVRSDLWSAGYSSLPIQLSAADVGAPHRRPRVIVVANSDRDCEPMRAINAKVAELQAATGIDGFWRSAPPGGFRLADGVPRAVDRNHAHGNAVVPQVFELIGRMVLEADRGIA